MRFLAYSEAACCGLFLLTLLRFLVFFDGGILKEIAYTLEPNEMNGKQIISTGNLSED